MVTSWRALTLDFARALPTFPEPMIPIFMQSSPFNHNLTCGRLYSNEHRGGRDADHHRTDQAGADLLGDQSGRQGEGAEDVAELTDLAETDRQLQRPSGQPAQPGQRPYDEYLGDNHKADEQQQPRQRALDGPWIDHGPER